MNYPKAEMKLSASASEQNVFLTYVCMINDVKPGHDKHATDSKHNKLSVKETEENAYQDDDHFKVERSKALHELVEAHADEDGTVIIDKIPEDTTSSTPFPTASEDSESDAEDIKFQGNDNPNILKLTKMKWLSEDRDRSPDSRSPSLSPASSSTSSRCSRESQSNLRQHMSFGDRYLSTILRLDKEHNLFGLSNIAIVGSRTSKKICKKDEKAVFHQTAIVQVCCGRKCCKHKSNTDLPALLKCGSRCRTCCVDQYCSSCRSCSPPCNNQPVCSSNTGNSCPRSECKMTPCLPSTCMIDCNTCYGLKLSLKKKPKFEPTYVELTPRSSCVLAKPQALRSCHHLPQCLPPSSCFPYLMPCYWPARAGAPCTNPAKCFHNPPCRPPRKPRSIIPANERCPSKCDASKKKCLIATCPGNIPDLKKAIQSRFGGK